MTAAAKAPGVRGRPEVDAIVAKIKAKNYGLRSLVHEIVQNDLFRTK